MRDALGSEIKLGDAVLVPYPQHGFGLGKIVHISSGLVDPNTQQSARKVAVTLLLEYEIAPNGVCPGVVKTAMQEVLQQLEVKPK